MKLIKGLAVLLLSTFVLTAISALITSQFIEVTFASFMIGYVLTLAVVIILLKRAANNLNVAAVTKAVTSAELNEEEFGKLISMTEIKGYKYKTSSVKRTYLFFGNYVYTIKFTKA